MPLSANDIKSELSYAYLHAIAAGAGCECQVAGRLSDNLGIDARIIAKGEFAPPPSQTLFEIYVQLKASSQDLSVVRNRISFPIEKDQYNKIREVRVANQWIIVLLWLPGKRADWLRTSHQALSVKKCAYWVSLRGAPPPPTGPSDKFTIHIPKRNRFNVEALSDLLVRCSLEDWVTYEHERT